MTELLTLAPLLLEFAARLVVVSVILVRGRGRPSTRLTWIILILVVPIVGVIAYLLVGEVRLGRRRVRRHRSIVASIEKSPSRTASPPSGHALQLPPLYENLATLAETVGNAQPRIANRVQLLAEKGEFIDALVADIDGAELHCHLLYYIFLADEGGRRVGEAMIRAEERGVQCRLMVDGVGSQDFIGSELHQRMIFAGVQVVESLPVNAVRMFFARLDVRNHRKIAVIDGVVGYVGSHNVADATFAVKARFAPWVDATARVAGPAARDLQVLFVEDWYLDTDESLEDVLAIHPMPVDDGVPVQVIGSGPSANNEAMRQLMLAAIMSAREELIITTPYFVPDEATATAIGTAARRGVETTLVLPARNDSPLVAAASRSEYQPLLQAGVRVREYQKGLLHAKTLTLDRSLAILGSANIDRRSFELNFEASLLVYDSDVASQLRFVQRAYMSDSVEVDEIAWRTRPWWKKLVQNAAGVLGPLL